MTDLDAMSDSELAAVAARCMGVTPGATTSSGVMFRPFPDANIRHFAPAANLGDAAELGDKFLAAWPDVIFDLSRRGQDTLAVFTMPPARVDGEDCQWWDASHASEARARTIACLKAWAALEGKG